MASRSGDYSEQPDFESGAFVDDGFFDYYDPDARDDTGFTGLHFSNLYDQDEDGAGEKYDLATGRPYNNSTDTLESMGLHIVGEDDEYDDTENLELLDHWTETQEGLARAAGLVPPLAGEDIA